MHENELFLPHQRRDFEACKQRFQKHYFTGSTTEGATFEEHQKKRVLAPFKEPS